MTSLDSRWAYVSVVTARPFVQELTYSVPAHLPALQLGHVVLVPLGALGETAYVLGPSGTEGLDPAKIRPVTRVVDAEPAFDAAQLEFFRWVADYYLAPLGVVLHTALPSRLGARELRVVEATERGSAALAANAVPGDAAIVLREVVSRPGLTARGLARRLDDTLAADAVAAGLAVCLRRGWIERGVRTVGKVGGRVTVAQLAVDVDVARQRIRQGAGRQLAVVEALSNGALDVSAVVAGLGGAARVALTKLVQLGVVTLSEREKRDALAAAEPLGPSVALALNAAQRAALDAVTASDAAGPWLLFGVTGSGKTEVFLGAADAALKAGRQVLVLVPEIGLTPQLVGRFRARFGPNLAVLHSGLTGAERFSEWRRVRAGDVSLAIGARSAIFAPFRNLGLVVVDEEHDDSYKQDDGVAYNARDLAVVLAKRHQCPVLLATATPSLESWANADRGRYRLLRLPMRATPRQLPEIQVVDVSAWAKPEERPVLLPEAEVALREAMDDGGQAIVLYNRRGWATMVECNRCGGTYECPNCGISMTLHKGRNEVVCHYCAFRLHYDGTCPRCKRPTLDEKGRGTERVEEAVRTLLPGVVVARMDADATAVRGSHAHLLTAFREGHTRVLVGTQMLAKGHDFPNVRCVVVVSADQPLRLPDFRAAERTWALLVQASGRAGRGEAPGRVVVQTWRPDHYAITAIHSPETFLREELRVRATLRYPPFSRLCLVRVDGVVREGVRDVAEQLARTLRKSANGVVGVTVMGPAPAALPRIAGRWRYQLVLRGESAAWRPWLGSALPLLRSAAKRGVRVSWDVDPRSIL